jgi:hypothetical protein
MAYPVVRLRPELRIRPGAVTGVLGAENASPGRDRAADRTAFHQLLREIGGGPGQPLACAGFGVAGSGFRVGL